MLLPLTVVLTTRTTQRHITPEVRSVSFTWEDPGGYRTARVALDRPLAMRPEEIAHYGELTVFDSRTGRVVWDGLLEDPSPTADQSGEVWELVAVGGEAHTRDTHTPVVYVDRDLTRWTPVEVTACPAGQRSVGEDETVFPGESSLLQLIPNGTPVKTNTSFVSSRYLPISHAGQKLGRIDYRWDSGRTHTDLRVRTYVRTAASWTSTATNVHNFAADTAGGGPSPKVVGSDFPTTRDTPEVRVQWIGAATTVGDDVTWGAWADLVVLGSRYHKDGSELLSGADYPENSVLSSEVVSDLLGRSLPMFDGANATVTPTTYAIQQLAYPDSVTPHRVLTDLMQIDAGFTWRVWERGPTGLYRFEWVPVPAAVRYEVDIRDGFYSVSSASGLFNRVRVRYRDSAGAIHTVLRTSDSPALDDAGMVRTGFLDLGDEIGTETDANRAGDQWLTDRAHAQNAGQITITRPVLDLETGMTVQPWEICPGLVRVRGVAPSVDALNASARDGSTVFRIRAARFDTDSASAILDLDSYAQSSARFLADLRRRQVTRRR